MAHKFAVFDIDGTLFRSGLYHEVVEELARRGKLSAHAQERITEAHQLWKRRVSSESFWDYVSTSVNEFEAALPQLKYSDYLEAMNFVFTSQKDHVYQYTKQLLQSLKGNGYKVIAISGSNQDMVEQFASYHGFDIAVGAVFEVKNGYFTGKNLSYTHADKHLVLEQLVQQHYLTYDGSVAIGDTHRDISILEVVEQAIAFNPNQQLFDTAKEKGWKVVIERKNMVYELEKSGKSYTLADTKLA